MHAHPTPDGPHRREGLDIGDILRRHQSSALAELTLSAAQRRVMNHIITCRTAVLGGHLDICTHCAVERPSYNSCRDRHCPKCQAVRQAQWVALRLERIIPVPHYHVVFTLPGLLRPLAKAHPEIVYKLLFQSASKTLAAFGRDPKWLGAQLGMTLVLHTWRRDLGFHPHIHAVVTAGGLSNDGERWVRLQRNPRFLFPVAALAKVFRGKFLSALRAHLPQQLAGLPADPQRLDKLMDRLHRTRWHVYAKRPFSDSKHLFQYLGRYTHRVALSNQRLIAINHDGVTFATKNEGQITLPPIEFIRRFLDHVLPDGFTKIRHYGLYASSHVNGRLVQARLLAAAPRPTPTPEPTAEASDTTPLTTDNLLTALFGSAFLTCPACGIGQMMRGTILPPVPQSRGPP